MSKKPFTDFDLPTKHLSGGNHFVPPKARSKEEIERRRRLPAGTLLAEYQYRGLAMSTIILGLVREPQDLESATAIISPAGLNTSWYIHALGSEVMRRRLKLAKLATDDPEQRPSSYMLHRQATDLFAEATDTAHRLVVATSRGQESMYDYKKRVARTVGHASLVLDSVEIGDQVGYGSIQVTDFELQHMARNRGLQVLQQARTLQDQIGEAPSLAGLADPDSGISVFFRRQATNQALEAYEQAYETMAAAA